MRTRLGRGRDSAGEGWQEGPAPTPRGRGAGPRGGGCWWALGRTHVRRELRISARLCLALLVAMARYRCRSMAQRRTGPSAAAEQGQGRQGAAVTGGPQGRAVLTLHGGGALAVVQDGQLPKHVTRAQCAQLPAPLGHPELPLCRDTARSLAHAHMCTHVHTRAHLGLPSLSRAPCTCGWCVFRRGCTHSTRVCTDTQAHTAEQLTLLHTRVRTGACARVTRPTSPPRVPVPHSHLPRCTWQCPRCPRPARCHRGRARQG